MNEESIKKFLTTCVYQEMNSFHPSQDEDYNHEFSKKFMKRWKRLNWSEKYFGSHLRLAYTVRKAAAVVIVILSLAAANQVSAKVFGFNAWKYLLSYDSKDKLEVREYVGQNQDEKRRRACRTSFMRNLHLCRRDFGIIPMMNFRREMHFMMNGEMKKRIHYSIAVVKLGKETKFTQILNMSKKLKQVLWAMRHIII